MATKTVICPECGAEQAIMREEDGTMKCVFCETPIDLPEYEEGEGLAYCYDEQPETQPTLDPVGEAIVATFVLSEAEVGRALTLAGKLKERKWILYVETALLIVMGLFMLVSSVLGLMKIGGFKPPQIINWFYVVLCFGMLPVIWLSPKKTKQKIIKNATSGNQLTLSVYENLINIHIEGRETSDDWQQPFDGSYGLLYDGELFILTLQSGQILVLPQRSLKEEEIETVKARLATKPE